MMDHQVCQGPIHLVELLRGGDDCLGPVLLPQAQEEAWQESPLLAQRGFRDVCLDQVMLAR